MIRTLALRLMLLTACAAPAWTAEVRTEIALPERAFPESITSTSDGTAYVSNAFQGRIYRVAPGASQVQVWEVGGPPPSRVFGLLAQERAGLLWACVQGPRPAPGQAGAPEIHTYDLKSGALRAIYAFQGKSCNDITVAADGTAYATDDGLGQILRLRKGESAFTPWATGSNLASADGIEILSDGILVNTFSSSTLQRIPINRDGSAGPAVRIQTDLPINRPDGMRRVARDRFVMAEGSGRLVEFAVAKDRAKVRILRAGLPDGPAGVTRIKGADLVTLCKYGLMAKPEVDPGRFVVVVVPHATS